MRRGQTPLVAKRKTQQQRADRGEKYVEVAQVRAALCGTQGYLRLCATCVSGEMAPMMHLPSNGSLVMDARANGHTRFYVSYFAIYLQGQTRPR